jgi:hypothetical protein
MLAIAALTAANAMFGGGFIAAATADEQIVTCGSKDYKLRVCPIDRDATEVELRRQLSGAECVNERTWGARFGEIWVDKGCAAEFIVYTQRGARPRGGEIVACGSKNYKYAECRISDRVREVELVRRTSGAPCVYGHSWGFDRGRLWVDRGCAGEFEVSTSDSGRGGQRRRHDDGHGRWDRGDRDRRGLELFFAERNAIRACRRYGEDHPDRMGANWADANPHESFRAEVQGRRDNDWIVSGRFKTFNRGREGNVRARCVVENDRVVRFDAN